jgi:hypothetical protein
LSATFGRLERMFSKRTTEGNAGLVEPEQLEDEAVDGTLTVATAGDAETPVDDAVESTQEPWEAFGFSSAQELADAYRNVNSLRGHLANQLGQLRSENEELRVQLDLGEADAAGMGQPNLASVLAEIDTRFITQLEQLAGALAQAVDARVAPIESKVDRLIQRFAAETAGFPGGDLDA